jgi:junctophilin
MNVKREHVYIPTGTYQGQWLRGLRHGYGIRQSAPFDDALPLRGTNVIASAAKDASGNNHQSGKQTDKQQHHKSMPVLTPSTVGEIRSQTTTDQNEDRFIRTRSGFALAGPGTGPTGVEGDPLAATAGAGNGPHRARSRSVSLRRTISESFGLTSAGRKKNKFRASTGDVPVMVSI